MHADIGELTLAFTVGGYPSGMVGFRVYGTWPGDSDQAVLAWDHRGRLRGVVVGWELGARRTGALGGAAAAALARPDVATVGVVGSGRQAWSQLWALTAVLAPSEVRVYSPTGEHRAQFAERSRSELGLAARAASSAEGAVAEADLVILATLSRTPVIDAGWIKDGAHVTTVGPKTVTAHETPPQLAERAALVASDSPEQALAYGQPFFTERPLVHLGAVLDGAAPGRKDADEITLYCSTGLAGSEVVIASALFADD
jgi:alanine dehydrogenase